MSAAATHAITWRVATSPSGSVEWGTPPAVYAALDQQYHFTLDAAAAPINAKHIRHLTKDVDALGLDWSGETVFCNPPYGRDLGRWVRKGLYEAVERSRGAVVVMLLPARTDVAWFHDYVLPHGEVRFIRGRLGYTRGGASRRARAPFASMVVVFRPGCRFRGVVRGQLLFPFLEKVPT